MKHTLEKQENLWVKQAEIVDIPGHHPVFGEDVHNFRLLRSVDFSKMELQEGDGDGLAFSFQTERPPENRAVCWLTYTNEATHRVIRANLDRSPLYDGDGLGLQGGLQPGGVHAVVLDGVGAPGHLGVLQAGDGVEHLDLHLLDIDYLSIAGLRLEARQKLDAIRPKNLGQAGRVPRASSRAASSGVGGVPVRSRRRTSRSPTPSSTTAWTPPAWKPPWR